MVQQGTIIHGVAASQAIDSSGEIIDIAGLDISSLDKDGVFNWSHKSDTASQIIGKILKAKKIFSEKDAEDDHQLYFWNKCKAPFVYVVGELFDAQGHSAAKDVAAMFRYDHQNRGKHVHDVIGFSIEGAKLSKESNVITRSIGRKVTIDPLPCNKLAVAEIVPSSKNKQKDDMDGIFKTESMFEVELLKSGGVEISLVKAKPMKKEIGMGLSSGGDSSLSGGAPIGTGGGMLMSEKPLVKSSQPKSIKIGRTSTGIDIMSHSPVNSYGFKTPKEHTEAAAAHEAAGKASKDVRWKTHHDNKAKIHASAARTLETGAREHAERANKLKTTASSGNPVVGSGKKLYDPDKSGKITPPGPTKKSEDMNKAGGVGMDREAPKQSKSPAIKPQNINRPDAGFGRIIGMGVGGAGMGGMGAAGGGVGKSEEMNKGWKTKAAGAALAGIAALSPSKAKAGSISDELNSTMNQQRERLKNYNPKPAPVESKEEKVKTTSRSGSMNAISEARSRLKGFPQDGDTEQKKSEKLKKGLDAGSGNAAPGGLGGGAVLGKEDMSGSMQKVGKPNKKSKWLQRAEQEYGKWSKREEFETYMAKRMPHLKKGEIKAIGQTICLSKSLKAEESLSKLNKESASQNYQHSWVSKKEK